MAAEPGQLLLGPVAANGFPARRLARSSNYQGGEWVTAYQAEQRSRLRAVFLSQQQRQSYDPGSRHLRPPTNTREASGTSRRVLDREFLMRHCFVEHPTDLSDADVSGIHQSSYKAEDFTEFDSLVHMNASDSALPMEAFNTFPALEQLELLACGIADISLDYTDFAKLLFLDLSYNAVSEMAVLALGSLPQLRELHLTGNNLVSLPVEMSRPFKITEEPSDIGSSLRMRFASLEMLWLDDNKLTDQTTFSTLAGLRRLRYVNLDNNELYTVPQLRLMGTRLLRTPASTAGSKTPHTRHSLTPRHGTSKKRGGCGVTPSEQQSVGLRQTGGGEGGGKAGDHTVCTRQQQTAVAATPAQYNTEEAASTAGTETREVEDDDGDGGERCLDERGEEEAAGSSTVEEVKGQDREREPSTVAEGDTSAPVSKLPPSMAPFPHLHTLSLANNMVFSSEGLVACGSWPSLKELIIHGNPLVSKCNGMPPRLQIELVQKNNIRIVRQKQSTRAPYRIGKKAKCFKKVSSSVPVVPVKSQLALPPPVALMIDSPSSLTSHTTLTTTTTTTSDQGPHGEESEDSVFITQGRSEQDSTYEPSERTMAGGGKAVAAADGCVVVRDVKKEMRKGLKTKYATANLPRHYRGYEALLEEDTAPTPPVPSDRYGCIHALQYSLKHTCTPSPFKTAPSTQTHTHHHGKLQAQQPLLQETATHRKVQDMHTALAAIRSSTAVLEENLADLLQMDTSTNKKSQKFQKEGRHLLKQLQVKYDEVRLEPIASSKHD